MFRIILIFLMHREYRKIINERQRQLRQKTNNADTKKYEKTKKGFIMRLYRNMKSRVTGVTKNKNHLYFGKDLMQKDKFYSWCIHNKTFHILFKNWKISQHSRVLTPSIDRINPCCGYVKGNIRFVTFSENCKNVRRSI